MGDLWVTRNWAGPSPAALIIARAPARWLSNPDPGRARGDMDDPRKVRRCWTWTIGLLGLVGCSEDLRVYTDSTGATVLADCDGDNCGQAVDGMECGGDSFFQGGAHIVACATVNGKTSDSSCRPIRCDSNKECIALLSGYSCIDRYCSKSQLLYSRATLVWECLARTPRNQGDCGVSDEKLSEVNEWIDEVCPSDGTPYQECPMVPEQCSLPE